MNQETVDDKIHDRMRKIYFPFQIRGNSVVDARGSHLFEAADHELAHILVDTIEEAIAICQMYPDNDGEEDIVYVN